MQDVSTDGSVSAATLHKAHTVSPGWGKKPSGHGCLVKLTINDEPHEWILRPPVPQEWIDVLKDMTAGEVAQLEGKQSFIKAPGPFAVSLDKIIRGRLVSDAVIWVDEAEPKSRKMSALAQLMVRLRGKDDGETHTMSILLGEDPIPLAIETALFTMRRKDRVFIESPGPLVEELRHNLVELEVLSAKDEVKPSTNELALERARELKEMGNTWINRENYTKAVERYDVAYDYIDTVQADPSVSSLKEAICGNNALALLKIGTKEAAHRCVVMCDTISTTLGSSSVKIRWRKGKALEILDEVAEAEWEFTEALKIEPRNVAVLRALDELRHKRVKHEHNEKKLYAKFLSKPTSGMADVVNGHCAGHLPEARPSQHHTADNSFQKFLLDVKGMSYTLQPENTFQHDLNPPIESRNLRERVLALESNLWRDKAKGIEDTSMWWRPLGLLFADMEEYRRSVACLLYHEPEVRLELAVTVANAGMGLPACYEFLRLWALGKGVEFGAHLEPVKDNETLEALLQAAPRGGEKHTALGIFYHTLQKYKEACGHFAAAIQFSTTSYQKAQQWNRLGACLCNSGRYEDAIMCQHQALSLHDCFPKAWHNVALAMRLCGRSEDAKAALLESKKLYASEHVENLLAHIAESPGDAGLTSNVEQLAETIRASCEKDMHLN